MSLIPLVLLEVLVLEAVEQSIEYPTKPVPRLAQHEALASSW